jgi:glycosyltransferase involved in cell wall biosynthesis
MGEPVGVTIVVVNYNNERFLAAAIDSALGQSHPRCEVIALDDCSTDNSVAVIAGYGNRIRSVLRTENGGQVEALNSAWPLARYPILIFLDSDDLLLVHAAATVAARWMASAVKMQSPLVTIDQTGREIGHMYPRFLPHLDTTTIRAEFLRTGGSAISPASGNAYSRSLLETVTGDGGFDLEKPRQYWMDTILACNAPFYGEVITLYEPIACYRIHDQNLYALTAVDSAYFTRMLDGLTLELEYFAARCRIWHIPFDPTAAYSRSLWALECRLIADKLTPVERRSTKQSLRQPVLRILYRALPACIEARLPISNRIIRVGWLIGVALSPSFLARRLIALRFIARQRPAWLERALTTLLTTRATTAGTARSFKVF